MLFTSHRDLMIDYSRIYSIASGVKPVDHKNPIAKVEDLKRVNVKIRRFVVLGLEWCEENFGRRNDGYSLKINYTFSCTVGSYFYYDKLFVIRVWNNQELIYLVEAIVHEYIHYLQFKSERIKLKSDKLRDELGYEHNPDEIEARIISNKLKNVCLNSLIAKIGSQNKYEFQNRSSFVILSDEPV